MEKNLKAGAFILLALVLGLFFVIFYLYEPKETTIQKKKTFGKHYHDYIIEVNGDSIPTYDLFDSSHNVIAVGVYASQLDSVIIADNE